MNATITLRLLAGHLTEAAIVPDPPQPPQPVPEDGEPGAANDTFQGILPADSRPVRGLIRRRLVDRVARESGKPRAVCEQCVDMVLAEMEREHRATAADRPFLDWLLNGGFEKILELVLKFLPLFLA